MDDGIARRDGTSRKAAVDYVNDTFQVSESVKHLQKMMKEVTQKEVTADTVNAACNCVANINSTIKTVITAAKYVTENK